MAQATIGELFMMLRHSATAAHVRHLATSSYSEHAALKEFYDGIVELADRMGEAYIGRYGRFDCPELPYSCDKDSVIALRRIRGWIDQHRTEVCDCREVQAIIDDVVELVDVTMYKVRFLR